MFSSWRRRKSTSSKKDNPILGNEDLSEMEILIPSHFRCPISLDLMKDPVTLPTGISYDRDSIEQWTIQSKNNTCPVTNQTLSSSDLIPNHTLRKMIQDWCVLNQAHGIERIPTPRIPISSYQVSDLCSRIEACTQKGDGKKCFELVRKIRNWGRESERNRKCIVENGGGKVLAACFEKFSTFFDSNAIELLEEILMVLTWMFPLDSEAQIRLGSSHSLNCMVMFLQSGKDLSSRQNSVLVLKKLLEMDKSHAHVDLLAKIEGSAQALVNLIADPLHGTTTKASLSTIHYMVLPSRTSYKTVMRFIDLGLVSKLLDLLVDGEKSVCEKAMAVLDNICDYKEGREEVCRNDLTIPVLVKKVLRVSELGTEFAVSMLWKLLFKCEDSGMRIEEAVLVGCFQKMLVVLQVGCGGVRRDMVKEKVTDLLKLLNRYRRRLDCVVDSSSLDFKHLKKSF